MDLHFAEVCELKGIVNVLQVHVFLHRLREELALMRELGHCIRFDSFVDDLFMLANQLAKFGNANIRPSGFELSRRPPRTFREVRNRNAVPRSIGKHEGTSREPARTSVSSSRTFVPLLTTEGRRILFPKLFQRERTC
jgi:hypothetical protein